MKARRIGPTLFCPGKTAKLCGVKNVAPSFTLKMRKSIFIGYISPSTRSLLPLQSTTPLCLKIHIFDSEFSQGLMKPPQQHQPPPTEKAFPSSLRSNKIDTTPLHGMISKAIYSQIWRKEWFGVVNQRCGQCCRSCGGQQLAIAEER